MSNKVRFGLKNVHYAPATISANNTATFETPVAIPGAVSLELDMQGERTKFRADNIDYWIGNSNNGYEGDLEMALFPDQFKIDVLGYVKDSHDVLFEDVDATGRPFALLFEFEGDANATRHVLYNCIATRPNLSGRTTEETITPETERATITASSIFNAVLNKNVAKASVTPDQTAQYNGWFGTVYQPTA